MLDTAKHDQCWTLMELEAGCDYVRLLCGHCSSESATDLGKINIPVEDKEDTAAEVKWYLHNC